MDGDLVSEPPPSRENGGASESYAPVKTYTERFWEAFPFFLSIGMTAEQFWEQDCCLTKYYRKAFELQQDRKNEELWLQGMYIYEALGDVSPLLHAFAKPGTKAHPYPDKPYPRTEKEVRKREEAERAARFEKARATMAAMANNNKS